jgi:hypothetical protein
MSQANTGSSQANSHPTTFAPMRGWCRTDAKVASHQREPVPSYNESYNDISFYNNIGSPLEKEIETEVSRKSKVRHQGRFLKGPIPMHLIAKAAKLPGQALALYLAVHHQTTLTCKDLVTLPSNLLAELGISRDAKARGLRHLEQASLIRIERSCGRSVRVGLTTAN